MKIFQILFAILALGSSTCAFADWGRPPPGWGGSCEVNFKTCEFQVGGFCAKWNHRSMVVSRHDAYYGCEIASRRYGHIKDCYVNCR